PARARCQAVKMARPRFPLLRGKISSVDTYQSPQPGRGLPPRLPSLDPHVHASGLLAQLDRIRAQVEARTDSERDELASREIVAIRALPETDLTPDQLDDSKQA